MRTLPFVGRTLVCTLALLVATACSDDPTGPALDGTVDGETAWWIANNVRSMTQDAVEGLNYGEPNIAFAPMPARARSIARGGRRELARPHLTIGKGTEFAAQLSSMVADGCTTTATGTGEGLYDPVDLNENDVPDDYHVKVSCVETYTEGETEYTDRDEWEVRVKERTGDLFGWDASLRYLESSHGSDGEWWEEGYSETRKLVINADGATSTYDGREWDNGNGSEGPWEWEWTGRFALDFDPDGAIALESYLPDGEVTLSGKVQEVDSHAPSTSFEIASVGGLTFDAACLYDYGQALTDGQVAGRLNGDPNIGFTILWLGCDEGYYIDVYGTSDDEGPPAAPSLRHAPLARPMGR